MARRYYCTVCVISSHYQSFATHGLLDILVSEMQQDSQVKCSANWYSSHHQCSFSPATNRLAKRGVQTLKDGLKKVSTGDIDTKLARLLLRYH